MLWGRFEKLGNNWSTEGIFTQHLHILAHFGQHFDGQIVKICDTTLDWTGAKVRKSYRY